MERTVVITFNWETEEDPAHAVDRPGGGGLAVDLELVTNVVKLTEVKR